MAVASRRNTAAIASALAAVALAMAVAGRSCGASEPAPVRAVKAMHAAYKAEDREAVLERLSPETLRRLDAAAQRATDLAGGAQRYKPIDLVSLSIADDEPEPEGYRLLRQDGDNAVVEVLNADGARAEVSLIRVDGSWRIDLPMFGAGL